MSEHERATGAETACWIIVGIAAAVWMIAGITYLNAASSYASTAETAALGWMTVAQSLGGVVLIPALLLTGARQLAARFAR